MAAKVRTRRKSSEWVGNAVYYIMGDLNRKSYSRNSRGFEPLDTFFPTKEKTPDADSDSDSGTEELIQQRLIEARQKRLAREKEEALSKESPPPTEDNTHSPSEKELPMDPMSDDGVKSATNVETIQAGSLEKSATVAKSKAPPRELTVTKPTTSSEKLTTHSSETSVGDTEQYYSPSVQPSLSQVSKRLLPSRLSFDDDSSSETDGKTRLVPTNGSVNKSKRRKTKSLFLRSKKKAANPPPPSDPSPSLEVGSHVDTGLSTTISFNPPISSTLNPDQIVLEATKKRVAKKREISTIRPIKRVPLLLSNSSDSETELNHTLDRLFKGAVSKMHSLQARTGTAKSAQGLTHPSSPNSEKENQLKEDLTGRKKLPYGASKAEKPSKNIRRSTRKSQSVEKEDSPSKEDRLSYSPEPAISNDTEVADSVTVSPPPAVSQKTTDTPKKFLKIRRLSIVLTKTDSPAHSNDSKKSSKKNRSTAKTKEALNRAKVSSRLSMPKSKKSKAGQKPASQTVTEEPKRTRSSQKPISNDRKKSTVSKGADIIHTGKESVMEVSGYMSDYAAHTSPAFEDHLPHSGEEREESPTDVSVLPRLKRKLKNHTQTAPPTKRPKPSSPDETTDEEFDLTFSPGGREYLRFRVDPGAAKTPGVRRSQRTRIPPAKTWLNEKVEYDTRRQSGVFIKGLLVPNYEVDDVKAPKKRNARKRATQEEPEPTESDYETLTVTNSSGTEQEWVVARTMGFGTKTDAKGQVASELSDVVFSRMHNDHSFTYGMITLEPLAMKGRSICEASHMIFHIVSGKLLFWVNKKEYHVQGGMTVHIPPGCVYSIRNVHRTKAECFYVTHSVSKASQSD